MRLFYSIMIFGVAIQISAYLLMLFHVDPNLTYPVKLSTGLFGITAFEAAFTGITGSVIMIAGLLLKQGTYAIYATLIWVVGMLINPIKEFFLAIPNTMMAIFKPIFDGMNPMPIDPVTLQQAENPILSVLVYIVAFAAFWFLVELVAQRQVS
jgi:hypothetical protein